MKNLHIFLIIILFISSQNWTICQVGINTTNPKGLLHISDTINSSKNILFTNEGNFGIGTTSPKAKLDVEGTMNIAKKNVSDKITNNVFTSDANGIGSWTYNDIAYQNKVSSFNIKYSTPSLFTSNQRLIITPTGRNELNLKPLSSNNIEYFAFSNVPKGLYILICNIGIENANSIFSISFSSTSITNPIESTCGSITCTGKKISSSIILDLDKQASLNYLYMEIVGRSRYLFSKWDDFTYWDTPWLTPTSGNFLITGTVDIIKIR